MKYFAGCSTNIIERANTHLHILERFLLPSVTVPYIDVIIIIQSERRPFALTPLGAKGNLPDNYLAIVINHCFVVQSLAASASILQSDYRWEGRLAGGWIGEWAEGNDDARTNFFSS